MENIKYLREFLPALNSTLGLFFYSFLAFMIIQLVVPLFTESDEERDLRLKKELVQKKGKEMRKKNLEGFSKT